MWFIGDTELCELGPSIHAINEELTAKERKKLNSESAKRQLYVCEQFNLSIKYCAALPEVESPFARI